ncbi:MAG: hypothetical protein ACTHLE_21270 [Agriterribacter sp.]
MKTLCFILNFIICLTAKAQYFEGVVRYDISYKAYTDILPEEELSKSGTLMVYNIKAGNYRFDILNGIYMEWMLYLDSTQKQYIKYFNNDTIYWKYVTSTPDTVLETSVKRKALKISNRICDEIVFKIPSGFHTYYFDPSIKIDKRYFLNHKNGNLANFVNISESIPIVEISESNVGLITSVASEIIKTEPPKHLFQLPANAIFAPALY